MRGMKFLVSFSGRMKLGYGGGGAGCVRGTEWQGGEREGRGWRSTEQLETDHRQLDHS